MKYMSSTDHNDPETARFTDSILDIVPSNLFFTVRDVARTPIYVKCEGLNAAGSIKIKAAIRIVYDFEQSGRLTKGHTLIESSSGNLGIALSMVAAEKGYNFICVTDPNAAQGSIDMMRALGADVITVTRRDENGGYLGTRINLIQDMIGNDPKLVWVNQYANDSNWKAHYVTTGPEILRQFPKLDWLVIGAGTTGTLMGCARYFRDRSPTTRVVGVDTKGSVTFGDVSGARYIPGLGTSRRPPIADPTLLDEIVFVSEEDTVAMCRRLARRGMLVGGSTGTVIAAIAGLDERFEPDDTVVTISPDLGGKYLDSIFDDGWVREKFGERSLAR